MTLIRSARELLDSLGLRKFPKLRVLLKRTYCRMIDPMGRGRRVPLSVGISVHVPSYFANNAYSNYEREAMSACLQWLQLNRDAVLADVGCSVAIYSLMALQSSARVKVFAFDPDKVALKTTAEFCRFADMGRLTLIHGFLSDHDDSGMNLATAAAKTRETLSSHGVRSEPTAVTYLRLDRPGPDGPIPRFTLDRLMLGEGSPTAPLLLKIDVEGAEMFVLRGASELLRRNRPTILLSVHPQFLPSYRHSGSDIETLLHEHDYRWTVLSTDHEAHWWCEPIDRTAAMRA